MPRKGDKFEAHTYTKWGERKPGGKLTSWKLSLLRTNLL
jgi:hypothetical protein